MHEDQSPTPPDLRALCQQAGAQAARWGTARPERRRPGRLWTLGLVGGALAALALVVVAAQFESQPAATSLPASMTAAPLQQTSSLPVRPSAVAGQDAAAHRQGPEVVTDFAAPAAATVPHHEPAPADAPPTELEMSQPGGSC